MPAIWTVNRHTAYVANGNLGDMFFLSDYLAQNHIVSAEAAASAFRALLHEHAVRMDVRPLALLILLGTSELGRPSLRGFDVIGSEFVCDAWAFGDGDARARARLAQTWRPGLTKAGAEDVLRRAIGSPHYEAVLLEVGR